MTDSRRQGGKARAAEGEDDLERARDCFRRQAWAQAYDAFGKADQVSPLVVDDLEQMALSAGLIGRTDDLLRLLERVYQARVQAGQETAAARAAFWLAMRLMALGEPARAGGWLARAQRLLEHQERDCVEQGYIMIPMVHRLIAGGDLEAAGKATERAAEIADRFGDADLAALNRHLQGRVALRQGRLEEALTRFDEAMVAAAAGDLSPTVTGLIYCAVIARYSELYALDRARELNSALSRWCEGQPEMVSFSIACQMHRAEIMQLAGAWPEAIEEARLACQRFAAGRDASGTAQAFYQQAEIHRLRGELAEAEAAYLQASQLGLEPQPGLALLRLAQGDHQAAASAICRVVESTADPLLRTRFLPAQVEILLASGDVDQASAGCRLLEEAAATFRVEVLTAMASHARGAIQLAQGDARAVLVPVRAAFEIWQRIGAPYLAARLRVLLGRACLALGDAEGARLELAAAREVFQRLGAASDLALLDALETKPAPVQPAEGAHGLTARELQVLRLVASGKTNRAIATELSLSEKTVDRHVSNIFNKIDVSTRAAATAYAYEHQLILIAVVGRTTHADKSQVLGNWPEATGACSSYRERVKRQRPDKEEIMTRKPASQTSARDHLIEEGAAFMDLAGLTPAPSRERLDVIVIGGGQAGLSVGHYLAGRGLRFVILEAGPRIGHQWRQRWDSLRLFTPARFDGLDGMPFPAPGDYFPTKDEMADYLEAYAARFQLPVRTGVRVERLWRQTGNGDCKGDGRYRVKAGALELEADQVVVAMASYQTPRVPEFARQLDPSIVQLHSKDYRRPDQLRAGPVLIAGAGNSGAEIAKDLAGAHEIWMSGRDTGHVPFRMDGLVGRKLLGPLVLRVVFHRILTVKTPMGRKARPKILKQGGPLIRVKPVHLKALGVERVGRVEGVRDGLPVLADGRVLPVANVVWCTGFHPGFSWIDLPVLDSDGEPQHASGVCPDQPGLYFVGLHFLHAMSSTMIHGVGRDAARIAGAVLARARATNAQEIHAPAAAARLRTSP